MQFIERGGETFVTSDWNMWPSGHWFGTSPGGLRPDYWGCDGTLFRSAIRQAALAALHLVGGGEAMTLAAIHAALGAAGYEPAGPDPRKALADALRYETKKGRVRRVARATYALSPAIPETTMRRYVCRFEAYRPSAGRVGVPTPEEHPPAPLLVRYHPDHPLGLAFTTLT